MKQLLHTKENSVFLRALCVSVVSSVVSLFVLQSCSIPDDGNLPAGEAGNIPTSKLEALTSLGEIKDSTKKEVVAIKAVPSKPILIARGSEPGWYAEFSANHLRLLINDGTDSLLLNHDFSDLVTNKPYKKTIVENSISLVIQIDVKPCNEMSGEKKEKSISLRYNNQNFKGCAGSK